MNKIIRAVTAFIFILQQVSPSQMGTAYARGEEAAAIQAQGLNMPRLEIPQSLGKLDEAVLNSERESLGVIVHIQNAHGNEDAQKNIQALLKYLAEKEGIKTVFLEGAVAELTPEVFRLFPDHKALNLRIAQNLEQKGELTGAEMYLIEQMLNGDLAGIKAFGMEEAASYRRNREEFQKVLRAKDRSAMFLKKMDEQIERLAAPHMSPPLKSFLRRLGDYEAGRVELMNWLGFLKEKALQDLKIDFEDPYYQLEWPMLTRIYRLSKIQNQVSVPQMLSEKKDLLEEFKRLGVEESLLKKMDQILSDNAALEAGSEVGYEEVVQTLTQLFMQLPQDFSLENFPGVKFWLQHRIIESEIRSGWLFKEIERLDRRISEQLAKSKEEKKLLSLFRDYRMLTKLFALELTRQDFEILSRRSEDLTPSKVVSRFKALNEEGRVRDVAFSDLDKAEKLYQLALSFYQGAKKRDEIMGRRVKSQLAALKEQKAVIVTGGFHATGMEGFFESAGFHYYRVSPKIGKVGESKAYHAAMLEENKGYQFSQIEKVLFSQPRQAIQAQGGNLQYLAGQVLGAMDEEAPSGWAGVNSNLLLQQYGVVRGENGRLGLVQPSANEEAQTLAEQLTARGITPAQLDAYLKRPPQAESDRVIAEILGTQGLNQSLENLNEDQLAARLALPNALSQLQSTAPAQPTEALPARSEMRAQVGPDAGDGWLYPNEKQELIQSFSLGAGDASTSMVSGVKDVEVVQTLKRPAVGTVLGPVESDMQFFWPHALASVIGAPALNANNGNGFLKDRADAIMLEALDKSFQGFQNIVMRVLGNEGERDFAARFMIGVLPYLERYRSVLGAKVMDWWGDVLEVTNGIPELAFLGAVSFGVYVEKGGAISVPDSHYAYRWTIGPALKQAGVQLQMTGDPVADVEKNLNEIAAKKNVPVSELKLGIMIRSRHFPILNKMKEMGVQFDPRHIKSTGELDFDLMIKEAKQGNSDGFAGFVRSGNVILVQDGDMMPVFDIMNGQIDAFLGLSGSNENMATAFIAKAFDGDDLYRLVPSSKLGEGAPPQDLATIKPNSDEREALLQHNLYPADVTEDEKQMIRERIAANPDEVNAHLTEQQRDVTKTWKLDDLIAAKDGVLYSSGAKPEGYPNPWLKSLDGYKFDPVTGDVTSYQSRTTISGDSRVFKITYTTRVPELKAQINNLALSGSARAEAAYLLARIYAHYHEFALAEQTFDQASNLSQTEEDQKRILAAKYHAEGMRHLVETNKKDANQKALEAFDRSLTEWGNHVDAEGPLGTRFVAFLLAQYMADENQKQIEKDIKTGTTPALESLQKVFDLRNQMKAYALPFPQTDELDEELSKNDKKINQVDAWASQFYPGQLKRSEMRAFRFVTKGGGSGSAVTIGVIMNGMLAEGEEVFSAISYSDDGGSSDSMQEDIRNMWNAEMPKHPILRSMVGVLEWLQNTPFGRWLLWRVFGIVVVGSLLHPGDLMSAVRGGIPEGWKQDLLEYRSKTARTASELIDEAVKAIRDAKVDVKDPSAPQGVRKEPRYPLSMFSERPFMEFFQMLKHYAEIIDEKYLEQRNAGEEIVKPGPLKFSKPDNQGRQKAIGHTIKNLLNLAIMDEEKVYPLPRILSRKNYYRALDKITKVTGSQTKAVMASPVTAATAQLAATYAKPGEAPDKQINAQDQMTGSYDSERRLYQVLMQRPQERGNAAVDLKPKRVIPAADPGVLKAVREASREEGIVLLGPGSKATSMLPVLMAKGVVDELINAKKRGVPVVWIWNSTQDIETLHHSMKSFIEVIDRSLSAHFGRPYHFKDFISHLVVNRITNEEIENTPALKKYRDKQLEELAKYQEEQRLTGRGIEKAGKLTFGFWENMPEGEGTEYVRSLGVDIVEGPIASIQQLFSRDPDKLKEGKKDELYRHRPDQLGIVIDGIIKRQPASHVQAQLYQRPRPNSLKDLSRLSSLLGQTLSRADEYANLREVIAVLGESAKNKDDEALSTLIDLLKLAEDHYFVLTPPALSADQTDIAFTGIQRSFLEDVLSALKQAGAFAKPYLEAARNDALPFREIDEALYKQTSPVHRASSAAAFRREISDILSSVSARSEMRTETPEEGSPAPAPVAGANDLAEVKAALQRMNQRVTWMQWALTGTLLFAAASIGLAVWALLRPNFTESAQAPVQPVPVFQQIAGAENRKEKEDVKKEVKVKEEKPAPAPEKKIQPLAVPNKLVEDLWGPASGWTNEDGKPGMPPALKDLNSDETNRLLERVKKLSADKPEDLGRRRIHYLMTQSTPSTIIGQTENYFKHTREKELSPEEKAQFDDLKPKIEQFIRILGKSGLPENVDNLTALDWYHQFFRPYFLLAGISPSDSPSHLDAINEDLPNAVIIFNQRFNYFKNLGVDFTKLYAENKKTLIYPLLNPFTNVLPQGSQKYLENQWAGGTLLINGVPLMDILALTKALIPLSERSKSRKSLEDQYGTAGIPAVTDSAFHLPVWHYGTSFLMPQGTKESDAAYQERKRQAAMGLAQPPNTGQPMSIENLLGLEGVYGGNISGLIRRYMKAFEQNLPSGGSLFPKYRIPSESIYPLTDRQYEIVPEARAQWLELMRKVTTQRAEIEKRGSRLLVGDVRGERVTLDLKKMNPALLLSVTSYWPSSTAPRQYENFPAPVKPDQAGLADKAGTETPAWLAVNFVMGNLTNPANWNPDARDRGKAIDSSLAQSNQRSASLMSALENSETLKQIIGPELGPFFEVLDSQILGYYEPRYPSGNSRHKKQNDVELYRDPRNGLEWISSGHNYLSWLTSEMNKKSQVDPSKSYVDLLPSEFSGPIKELAESYKASKNQIEKSIVGAMLYKKVLEASRMMSLQFLLSLEREAYKNKISLEDLLKAYADAQALIGNYEKRSMRPLTDPAKFDAGYLVGFALKAVKSGMGAVKAEFELLRDPVTAAEAVETFELLTGKKQKPDDETMKYLLSFWAGNGIRKRNFITEGNKEVSYPALEQVKSVLRDPKRRDLLFSIAARIAGFNSPVAPEAIALGRGLEPVMDELGRFLSDTRADKPKAAFDFWAINRLQNLKSLDELEKPSSARSEMRTERPEDQNAAEKAPPAIGEELVPPQAPEGYAEAMRRLELLEAQNRALTSRIRFQNWAVGLLAVITLGGSLLAAYLASRPSSSAPDASPINAEVDEGEKLAKTKSEKDEKKVDTKKAEAVEKFEKKVEKKVEAPVVKNALVERLWGKESGWPDGEPEKRLKDLDAAGQEELIAKIERLSRERVAALKVSLRQAEEKVSKVQEDARALEKKYGVTIPLTPGSLTPGAVYYNQLRKLIQTKSPEDIGNFTRDMNTLKADFDAAMAEKTKAENDLQTSVNLERARMNYVREVSASSIPLMDFNFRHSRLTDLTTEAARIEYKNLKPYLDEFTSELAKAGMPKTSQTLSSIDWYQQFFRFYFLSASIDGLNERKKFISDLTKMMPVAADFFKGQIRYYSKKGGKGYLQGVLNEYDRPLLFRSSRGNAIYNAMMPETTVALESAWRSYGTWHNTLPFGDIFAAGIALSQSYRSEIDRGVESKASIDARYETNQNALRVLSVLDAEIEAFMPQFPDESDRAYANRVSGAFTKIANASLEVQADSPLSLMGLNKVEGQEERLVKQVMRIVEKYSPSGTGVYPRIAQLPLPRMQQAPSGIEIYQAHQLNTLRMNSQLSQLGMGASPLGGRPMGSSMGGGAVYKLVAPGPIYNRPRAEAGKKVPPLKGVGPRLEIDESATAAQAAQAAQQAMDMARQADAVRQAHDMQAIRLDLQVQSQAAAIRANNTDKMRVYELVKELMRDKSLRWQAESRLIAIYGPSLWKNPNAVSLAQALLSEEDIEQMEKDRRSILGSKMLEKIYGEELGPIFTAYDQRVNGYNSERHPQKDPVLIRTDFRGQNSMVGKSYNLLKDDEHVYISWLVSELRKPAGESKTPFIDTLPPYIREELGYNVAAYAQTTHAYKAFREARNKIASKEATPKEEADYERMLSAYTSYGSSSMGWNEASDAIRDRYLYNLNVLGAQIYDSVIRIGRETLEPATSNLIASAKRRSLDPKVLAKAMADLMSPDEKSKKSIVEEFAGQPIRPLINSKHGGLVSGLAVMAAKDGIGAVKAMLKVAKHPDTIRETEELYEMLTGTKRKMDFTDDVMLPLLFFWSAESTNQRVVREAGSEKIFTGIDLVREILKDDDKKLRFLRIASRAADPEASELKLINLTSTDMSGMPAILDEMRRYLTKDAPVPFDLWAANREKQLGLPSARSEMRASTRRPMLERLENRIAMTARISIGSFVIDVDDPANQGGQFSGLTSQVDVRQTIPIGNQAQLAPLPEGSQPAIIRGLIPVHAFSYEHPVFGARLLMQVGEGANALQYSLGDLTGYNDVNFADVPANAPAGAPALFQIKELPNRLFFLSGAQPYEVILTENIGTVSSVNYGEYTPENQKIMVVARNASGLERVYEFTLNLTPPAPVVTNIGSGEFSEVERLSPLGTNVDSQGAEQKPVGNGFQLAGFLNIVNNNPRQIIQVTNAIGVVKQYVIQSGGTGAPTIYPNPETGITLIVGDSGSKLAFHDSRSDRFFVFRENLPAGYMLSPQNIDRVDYQVQGEQVIAEVVLKNNLGILRLIVNVPPLNLTVQPIDLEPAVDPVRLTTLVSPEGKTERARQTLQDGTVLTIFEDIVEGNARLILQAQKPAGGIIQYALSDGSQDVKIFPNADSGPSLVLISGDGRLLNFFNPETTILFSGRLPVGYTLSTQEDYEVSFEQGIVNILPRYDFNQLQVRYVEPFPPAVITVSAAIEADEITPTPGLEVPAAAGILSTDTTSDGDQVTVYNVGGVPILQVITSTGQTLTYALQTGIQTSHVYGNDAGNLSVILISNVPTTQAHVYDDEKNKLFVGNFLQGLELAPHLINEASYTGNRFDVTTTNNFLYQIDITVREKTPVPVDEPLVISGALKPEHEQGEAVRMTITGVDPDQTDVVSLRIVSLTYVNANGERVEATDYTFENGVLSWRVPLDAKAGEKFFVTVSGSSLKEDGRTITSSPVTYESTVTQKFTPNPEPRQIVVDALVNANEQDTNPYSLVPAGASILSTGTTNDGDQITVYDVRGNRTLQIITSTGEVLNFSFGAGIENTSVYANPGGNYSVILSSDVPESTYFVYDSVNNELFLGLLPEGITLSPMIIASSGFSGNRFIVTLNPEGAGANQVQYTYRIDARLSRNVNPTPTPDPNPNPNPNPDPAPAPQPEPKPNPGPAMPSSPGFGVPRIDTNVVIALTQKPLSQFGFDMTRTLDRFGLPQQGGIINLNLEPLGGKKNSETVQIYGAADEAVEVDYILEEEDGGVRYRVILRFPSLNNSEIEAYNEFIPTETPEIVMGEILDRMGPGVDSRTSLRPRIEIRQNTPRLILRSPSSQQEVEIDVKDKRQELFQQLQRQPRGPLRVGANSRMADIVDQVENGDRSEQPREETPADVAPADEAGFSQSMAAPGGLLAALMTFGRWILEALGLDFSKKAEEKKPGSPQAKARSEMRGAYEMARKVMDGLLPLSVDAVTAAAVLYGLFGAEYKARRGVSLKEAVSEASMNRVVPEFKNQEDRALMRKLLTAESQDFGMLGISVGAEAFPDEIAASLSRMKALLKNFPNQVLLIHYAGALSLEQKTKIESVMPGRIFILPGNENAAQTYQQFLDLRDDKFKQERAKILALAHKHPEAKVRGPQDLKTHFLAIAQEETFEGDLADVSKQMLDGSFKNLTGIAAMEAKILIGRPVAGFDANALLRNPLPDVLASVEKRSEGVVRLLLKQNLGRRLQNMIEAANKILASA